MAREKRPPPDDKGSKSAKSFSPPSYFIQEFTAPLRGKFEPGIFQRDAKYRKSILKKFLNFLLEIRKKIMKIKELESDLFDSNYRYPAPLQKNCRISNHAEDFLLNYINAKIGENGFALPSR